MKLNTNSNVYTIVYATIVVIIVAVLLALTNQALKPKQDANVKLDQQKHKDEVRLKEKEIAAKRKSAK